MGTKEQHLAYLREKGEFPVNINRKLFSDKDLQTLKKHGFWFMALEKGELEPFTQAQIDFIRDIGQNEPPKENEYAFLWWKYRYRCKIEKDPLFANSGKLGLAINDFYTWEEYRNMHPGDR